MCIILFTEWSTRRRFPHFFSLLVCFLIFSAHLFQALGKIPVDAVALGVDYLTIAGHKFYGPRAGALYVRGLEEKATPLYPFVLGGGQERGYRSG